MNSPHLHFDFLFSVYCVSWDEVLCQKGIFFAASNENSRVLVRLYNCSSSSAEATPSLIQQQQSIKINRNNIYDIDEYIKK